MCVWVEPHTTSCNKGNCNCNKAWSKVLELLLNAPNEWQHPLCSGEVYRKCGADLTAHLAADKGKLSYRPYSSLIPLCLLCHAINLIKWYIDAWRAIFPVNWLEAWKSCCMCLMPLPEASPPVWSLLVNIKLCKHMHKQTGLNPRKHNFKYTAPTFHLPEL